MTDMVLAVRITADGAQLVSVARDGAASVAALKSETEKLDAAQRGGAVAAAAASAANKTLAVSEAEAAVAARAATGAQVQLGAATAASSGAVAGFSRGMGGLALVVGGVITAMGAATTRSLELGTNLAATSAQLGISTGALQGYRAAARASGTDVGALEGNISKLTQRIGQAAVGGRDAVNSFAALRVGFALTDGSVRGTEAVLHDVIERLNGIADPARRAQLGSALLGDEYQRIEPLLAGGAEGLQRLNAALDDQNDRLTPAQVATLAAANAEYKHMQETLGQSIAATVADNSAALLSLAHALGTVSNWSIRAAAAWGQLGSTLSDFSAGQYALLSGAMFGGAPAALGVLGRIAQHNQDERIERGSRSLLTSAPNGGGLYRGGRAVLPAPRPPGSLLYRGGRGPSAPGSLLYRPDFSPDTAGTPIVESAANAAARQRRVVAPARAPAPAALAHAGAAVAIPTAIAPRHRGGGGGGGGRGRNRGVSRAARDNGSDRDFARSLENTIKGINDRWSEQPSLIQQSNAAQRQLNATIEEAQERLARRGIGAQEAAALRDRISEAQQALSTVQNGLSRPFRDMIAASERQRDLQLLVLTGREQEADVLQRIQQMEEKGVEVTTDRRAQIEQMVDSEAEINRLLERRQLVVDAYSSTIGDVRSSLEDFFAGGSAGDFAANLESSMRRLQSRLRVESLFGDGLRDLEQKMRRETGFEGVVDTLGRQTTAASTHMAAVGESAMRLANSFDAAGDVVRAIGTSLPENSAITAQLTDLSTSLGQEITRGILSDLEQTGWMQGTDIVATGRREPERPTLANMSPNDFMRDAARVVVAPLREGIDGLDRLLGTSIAGPLAGALEGGLVGKWRAGDVGMVLGAVQGTGKIKGKAGKKLGQAMDGAEQGYQIAQIGKMLGIKSSSTGGAIGGAIGGATGIPGMDIVGSIVGSVLGGLLKKTPKGTLSITADGATYAGSGKLRESLTSAGSSVTSTLASIAEQLGGEVGSFSGSIRQKGKKVYANGTRVADLEAAASKILSDALTGGGLTGISGAVRKALGSSSDIDKAVKEALKVQQVEDLLGGIGAAMTRQFRSFETQAKERVRIAEQYGFDVVEIEKRNVEDRAKIAEQILGERVGPLRDLLKDMRVGSLFEGTAADRRSALLTDIAKAKTDAEAGKDGAAATLADLQRRLIDTSREAYGTAGTEYASDRSDTISTAERIIALENDRVKAAQDAAIATKTAVEANNALTSESNDLLARIATGIDQLSLAGIPAASGMPGSIGRLVEL